MTHPSATPPIDWIAYHYAFWAEHTGQLELALREQTRMKPIDKTARSRTDSLEFELELAHSPKKVWRAITEPALLAEWLLPVVGGELELGSAFMLKAQPVAGWDGTVKCKVLELEAERMLRYRWVVGDFLDTVVSFTLTPAECGTRLSIVQSGFKPDQKQNHAGARYGWRMMAGKLIDLLARSR